MIWHRQVCQREKEKVSDCENLNYGSEWDSKKLERSVQRLEQKGRTKSFAKESFLLKNLAKPILPFWETMTMGLTLEYASFTGYRKYF